MILTMIENHEYEAERNKKEHPCAKGWNSCWIAIGSGCDHLAIRQAGLVGCLLQAENRRSVLVDEFDDSTAAARNAGHGIVSDDDGQSGFFHQ